MLVVLLTAAEISDPTAAALERAARDVLGPDATVNVISEPAPLADEAALARAGPADGVVELSWDDQHRTAELHCYLTREGRWLDRTITFDREDEDVERGRLLGFAIGSMLAENDRSNAATESAATVIQTAPESGPRDADSETAKARRRLPSRWLEVGGSATTGIEGSADALGVSIGLRLRLAPSIRLVFGAGGLFGEVDEAQATYRSITGNAGLVWQPIEPRGAGEFGFGIRAEALGGWLQVSHLSEDDPAPDRQSRFIGGGRGFLEGAVGVSESACTYLALGSVITAGRTDLYTHGAQAATIPAVWLMAELGVRTAF